LGFRGGDDLADAPERERVAPFFFGGTQREREREIRGGLVFKAHRLL